MSRSHVRSILLVFVAGWAQHDFPQRLCRVRPEGFDYKARRARDWLRLLNEWRRGVR